MYMEIWGGGTVGICALNSLGYEAMIIELANPSSGWFMVLVCLDAGGSGWR